MSFVGFPTLEDTFHVGLQTRSGDLPTDADALPDFRVYSANGLLDDAGGQATYLEAGTVTGATNANPIVVTTSSPHNLTTGMRVKMAGVGGNTAANTTAVVTALTATTFSIAVAGNGAYTSGGTWHTAGLYDLAVECTALNGFDSGETYTLVATYAISAAARADTFVFGVV